jgi:hypothetical protein
MTIEQLKLPADILCALKQLPLGDPALVLFWNENRINQLQQEDPSMQYTFTG